jgi:hypothetical protein
VATLEDSGGAGDRDRTGDVQLDALNGGSVAAGADRDEQLRRIIWRMTPNTVKKDKALAILDGKA